jgi:tartrate-resistant acid phosphatase type 5
MKVMKQTRREFVRILFVATQGVAASRFLPALLEAAPEPGGLNFLIFGDWGRQGDRDQVEVAAQMAKAAQQNGAQFIISVGDNFYDDGVASVHDAHWSVSFEKVYDQKPLQIPWHVILGNHDYHGNCDAQIAYHAAHPRWNMPARYYVQSHSLEAGATADFFYLDTTPMVKSYRLNPLTRGEIIRQDVPKQMEWFRGALAASKARWKIVIGHHPIYSGGLHGDTPELVETILPLLHQHKVQAYFNGHDHDLQHLRAGGVNLFDTGAGSEFRRTKATPHTAWSKACSGFTTVSLRADRMDVRMIDNHGAMIYATTVQAS